MSDVSLVAAYKQAVGDMKELMEQEQRQQQQQQEVLDPFDGRLFAFARFLL